ncbi:MAG: hypothetical protein UZ18_ATM001001113 [Armatimonadetes bacterium OLB18]|nr:MAG: hypothetical protein UZ18_ATM001001113 [Armatimonadetes bacterium OLB18]
MHKPKQTQHSPLVITRIEPVVTMMHMGFGRAGSTLWANASTVAVRHGIPGKHPSSPRSASPRGGSCALATGGGARFGADLRAITGFSFAKDVGSRGPTGRLPFGGRFLPGRCPSLSYVGPLGLRFASSRGNVVEFGERFESDTGLTRQGPSSPSVPLLPRRGEGGGLGP